MDWSIGDNKVFLIFFELELTLVNLHVKKEQLLVGSCNTELVLCYSLAGRVHSFKHCIVHTEGMDFLV